MHTFDEKLLNVSIKERGRYELQKDLIKKESEWNSQTNVEEKTYDDSSLEAKDQPFQSEQEDRMLQGDFQNGKKKGGNRLII